MLCARITPISSRHDIVAADDAEAMLKASQVAALSEDVPQLRFGPVPVSLARSRSRTDPKAI